MILERSRREQVWIAELEGRTEIRQPRTAVHAPIVTAMLASPPTGIG
ncbi:hypothetical protein [Rhodococcus opacus]|nr:hypothetical protein [Rhodococcus opacus]